jgi:hypothetical protein
MKKLIFITVIGLIFIFKLEAKKIEGQIFYKNDTVYVTMNIPVKFFTQEINYKKLQYKIKYFDSLGVKKVLRPDDAEEIRFTYQYEKVRMLSRTNTLGLGNIFSMSSNIFLRIEIDGVLKLFTYYYTQSYQMNNTSIGMSRGVFFYGEEKSILQKGDGELKIPKGLRFKKDMIQYFNDCPELSKKIEVKVFRKCDLDSIVRFYNRSCT